MVCIFISLFISFFVPLFVWVYFFLKHFRSLCVVRIIQRFVCSPRRARRGRAGARRAPRGRPRRPPQLGRSTGRARLASRVAAAAGPPGARAPAGGRPPPATGAPAAPGPGNPPGPAAPPPRPPRRGGGGGAGGERGGGAGGSGAGWRGGRAPRGRPRAWGGRRRLVQPRRAPSPASRPSPTDPALRANPYPEVTDPACRLPLPTLFQHARGCSPWRPAADMGTARREIYTLSPGFSRASESSPDAAGTATLSKARAPLSGRTHSRAPCPSQRKENSPRGSRRLLRDRLRYRTGRLAAPISATPDSGI